MLEGHEFVRIDNIWLLDFTEHIGYKLHLDSNNNVTGYEKAFTIERQAEKKETETTNGSKSNSIESIDTGDKFEIVRFIDIPVRVLKEVERQIRGYAEDF